jgi:hypothetical protein
MKNLEKAYVELERRSLIAKHAYELAEIFKEARDELLKNSESDHAQKAQYEIDFLSFDISSNKLSPLYSTTNEKGELIEYPSLKKFSDESFDYLKKRYDRSTAQNLIARYAHILWLSSHKKIQYAHSAIDNYLELLEIREKQVQEYPERRFGLAILEILKNSFGLSLSVKYRVDDHKNEILRIVHEFPFENSSSYVIKYQLIELMLTQKKLFELDDFEGVIDICESLFSRKIGDSKHSAIDILNLIIKVQHNLSLDTERVERRIAELWENLSIEREDGMNLVSSDFCKNAINIYRKLKDQEKVKELEKRFTHLKKNIKLSEFKHEFDLSEMMSEFRNQADKLTENDPFTIINSLINDKSLLPTLLETKKLAQEKGENSFLSAIGNNSILDRNGNTLQYFNEPEELEYYELLQSYRFTLELSRNHLIREIFLAAAKKGKLNSNSVLAYLEQHSWLGKELELSTNGDKSIPYSWLALIAPALNEYFFNLEFYFRNKDNGLPLVLCIDSLSLKIEGMIRDICEFNGIPTFDLKSDKKGRTISQEKDIHRLLYEPEITELFDEDDLLFFKFLLIEKAGYNLRHRVAHSLMTFYDYHIDLMNLLIMAILKFGKYNFTEKENNKSTTTNKV